MQIHRESARARRADLTRRAVVHTEVMESADDGGVERDADDADDADHADDDADDDDADSDDGDDDDDADDEHWR